MLLRRILSSTCFTLFWFFMVAFKISQMSIKFNPIQNIYINALPAIQHKFTKYIKNVLMLIHQARLKPVPGIFFHHYTASTIHYWIGKRKKKKKKEAGGKVAPKNLLSMTPISSIYLPNLQAIILRPRAANSSCYPRTVSSTAQTGVIVSKSGLSLSWGF